MKFHEHPSCGSQAAPGRWMDGQTCMMMLVVACHNVANVAKNNTEIMLWECRECDLCHWTFLPIWHTFLPWRFKQQVFPKHWYKPTKLYDVTFQGQCSL